LQPHLTPDERSGLQRSAQSLKDALQSVRNPTTLVPIDRKKPGSAH
jgi:hypothetical protein